MDSLSDVFIARCFFMASLILVDCVLIWRDVRK